MLGVTNAAATPTAQAGLGAAEAVSPGYSQLSLDQMQKFAVPFANVGRDVAMANANTNNALLSGAGGESALRADALNRVVNPEYYNVRSAAGAQTGNLLNSINLGGLSGGETAAVERSLNQSNTATGNLGLDNATNAVSNAMNFGNYLNTKRSMLGQALGAANNFMSTAQNTQFNPVSLALQQAPAGGGGSFGLSNFTPVTTPGNAAMGFGQNTLGNITGLFGQNAGPYAKGTYDASTLGATQAVLGASICCFIFLEAYNGQLPWWVRACRDFYYFRQPELSVGYKRMSKWLVPLMKNHKLVRWLTNILMVRPLTQYGKYLVGIDKRCKHYAWSQRLWFWVWTQLAK